MNRDARRQLVSCAPHAAEPVSGFDSAIRSGDGCWCGSNGSSRDRSWSRRRREGGGWRIGSNSRSSGRLRQRIERIQGFVGDVDDGGHRGSRRSRCIESLGLGCRPQVVSSHRGRRGALARRVNAAPPPLSTWVDVGSRRPAPPVFSAQGRRAGSAAIEPTTASSGKRASAWSVDIKESRRARRGGWQHRISPGMQDYGVRPVIVVLDGEGDVGTVSALLNEALGADMVPELARGL